MNALCLDFCLAYPVLEHTSANELVEIGSLLAYLKDKLQPIRDRGRSATNRPGAAKSGSCKSMGLSKEISVAYFT